MAWLHFLMFYKTHPEWYNENRLRREVEAGRLLLSKWGMTVSWTKVEGVEILKGVRIENISQNQKVSWLIGWGYERERQFNSVVSNSLWPHGQQHTRPPCPSPPPRVYPHSCPLSQWCYPTITSSVVPFSSRLQSFPASGSFQMNQFFALGGQSIGVSASTSFLPKNIQDWFLQDGLVGSPCSPRDSQESSPTPQFKSISSLVLSFLYSLALTSIHDYWKNHSFG